jgi:hypothetical protein
LQSFPGSRKANRWDRQPFRIINAGQGFAIVGAWAVDLFRRLLVKLISHRIDFGSDEWRHQCDYAPVSVLEWEWPLWCEVDLR